jgi:hypothetical protein
MQTRRNQRGQVLPLLVLVVALAGVLVVVLGRLGQAAVDRAHARTAADAAALAGAAAGESAARDLAQANGATLLWFRAEGRDVEVAVRFRRAEAVARARREGPGTARAATGRAPPAR